MTTVASRSISWRWLSGALVVALIVIVAGLTTTSIWGPELLRRLVVARLEAVSGRPAAVGAAELDLWRGRISLRDVRVAELAAQGDGAEPFVALDRLDLHLRVLPLLLGRVRVRDAQLSAPTVRVVRKPDGDFNFSDLLRGPVAAARPVDLEVERFSLRGGTVVLVDRALREPRTWTSERIEIDARDVSTRHARGSATGRSVTAGAPVTIEMTNLRLHPVELKATVESEGLDLGLADVYVPPDAPVRVARGRATTRLSVTLHAREGLSADATARFEDVVLVPAGGGEPLAIIPALTAELGGFGFRDDAVRVGRLAADGTMSVRDPTARAGAPLRLSTVRARVEDLTWPATTPGRLDVQTSIPGGGTLTMSGMVRPPPAATQLRLRVTDMNLSPWARLLPIAARVTGRAQADLWIDEALDAGVPARIEGSVAIDGLGASDGRRELLGARRVVASGLALTWPERLVVDRLLISGPRAVVDRDRDGALPIRALFAPAPGAPDQVRAPGLLPPAPCADCTASPRAALAVQVQQVVVQDGHLAWRDETVSPAARLDVSSVTGQLTGLGWPLTGPLGVRATLRPPGGGHVGLSGRIALDPAAADLRVVARNAELAPYQAYLATPARVSGAADLEAVVVVPSFEDRRVQIIGKAGLSRVDVRDGERTVLRLERATATGMDVAWPEHIEVARLSLAQPWVLIERDTAGALTLRSLLTPRGPRGNATPGNGNMPKGQPADGKPADAAPSDEATAPSEPVTVAVERVDVQGGGMRVVDHRVAPPFALDLASLAVQVNGFSTEAERPARIVMTGRAGPSGDLALRGTVRGLGAPPLLVDVSGEVRNFAVPRTNPYMLQQVGWQTSAGALHSTFHCKVDGDALSAKTDLRISQLQLLRAAAHDEAENRIGLPLGMLVSLLKDRHGDIKLSIPVGGRVGDPRFDFRDTIWRAVRTVSVNAVMLPFSWIGRVRLDERSRIERLEVDPVPFPPGAGALTADAEQRIGRLAAFMTQLPEARLAVTPVVSSRDAAELRRLRLEAALERATRDGRVSRDLAAERLFEKRLPGRRLPSTTEATLAALAEAETVSDADLDELASRRLSTLRTALKRAGIDGDRLPERAIERGDGPGQVQLEVVEMPTERPSKVRRLLERLGVPLRAPAAKE
jgi:hypothetical protein